MSYNIDVYIIAFNLKFYLGLLLMTIINVVIHLPLIILSERHYIAFNVLKCR